MKLKLKNQSGTYSITDDSVRDVQINGINTNLAAMQNVLGAKNLLPISLQSQTVDGEITVTVNTADKSITLNGTASTVKVINFQSTFMLPAGNWDILQFDGSTNYYVQVAYNNAPVWWNGVSENAHLFELIEPKEMSAQLVFAPGTYINETIKVMIVPQGTDPTYVPYSMTNRELTELIIRQDIPINIEIPAKGYNYIDITPPTGYEPFAVNTLYNSLSLFAQPCHSGHQARISLFNATDAVLTYEYDIRVWFIKL